MRDQLYIFTSIHCGFGEDGQVRTGLWRTLLKRSGLATCREHLFTKPEQIGEVRRRIGPGVGTIERLLKAQHIRGEGLEAFTHPTEPLPVEPVTLPSVVGYDAYGIVH